MTRARVRHRLVAGGLAKTIGEAELFRGGCYDGA